MIYVIATFDLKPGMAAALAEAARPCLEATRKEEGCIFYDLTFSSTNPDQATMVERWESRAHLQAHFSTPHIEAWKEVSGPMMLGRTVEIIHTDKVETL